MIRLQRITDVESPEYLFVEKLLVSAFPKEEYRDLSEFKSLTGSNSKFHNNIIYDSETPVGIITYWAFDGFFYFEHLATSPEFRNNGIGKRVFEILFKNKIYPLVLEVEFPVDELTARRVRFYERQGLRRWNSEYFQPPYRKSDGLIKMLLMVYGDLSEQTDYERVKRTIYKEVYNYV